MNPTGPVRIPITKPFFGPEDLEAVQRPLETGWIVQGPFVKAFEDAFAGFVGSPHGVATSSCTTALHLALAALGTGPGDEVIVPAFTWVSTANAVEHLGARAVFCDVDLATFNIDVAAAEALVTPRTVGILPVHLFGLCADMEGIQAMASRHHLWVVEDAACAFGARFRGQHAGTFGAAGCFSFHPRKSITTGEGGILTTASDELQVLASSLRDHGATRSDRARHEEAGAFLLAAYPHLGFNYRMTDIQGALGCAQMTRAQWILDRRAELARGYDERLAGLEWLVPPLTPAGYVHGFQSYVCLFRPEAPSLATVDRLHHQRNTLMRRLESLGIATRQGTHAAALVDYYAGKYGLRPEQFPNAWLAERLSLSLPLYAQMTDAEQDQVVDACVESLAFLV